LAKAVLDQVRFEIELIERLFASYSELLQKVELAPPNLVEITALASVLHSFYTGLENIFQAIAKGIDCELPAGEQWHRDLLWQMARATTGRACVISDVTARRLLDYLAFRHFYRHAYSFFLDWNELSKLAHPMAEVWAGTRRDLEKFLEAFDEMDSGS
jgi:hypothetical protein